MKYVQELIRDLVYFIHESDTITYQMDSNTVVYLYFSQPFQQISVVPELEKRLGRCLPDLNDPSK